MSLSISEFIQQTHQLSTVGDTKILSATDCPLTDPLWTATVRYLESEGWSIGTLTADSQLPVFVAEIERAVVGADSMSAQVTPPARLTGFGLADKTIQQIHIQRVGLPLRSRQPEAPKHTEPGLKFVPHHTMALCIGDTATQTYSRPFFVPSSQIGVSVADNTAMQYGQGAFEGGCAMIDPNDEAQALLFRIEQNGHRFQKSCQALGLPALDTDVFVDICTQLVAANQAYLPTKNGKMYIRPSIVGLHGGLGVNVPDQCLITFEVAAFGDYLPAGITVEGLLDTHRPPTGADKVAPNYGGSFLVKKGVKKRGYHDFMSFDVDGHIEEVSTCAVGCLQKNSAGDFEIIFPYVREDDPNPDTAPSRHSLDSITRRSVIEILERLGYQVTKRPIHYAEIKYLDGIFTMGNAVGVIQVDQIDLRPKAADEVLFTKNFESDSSVKDFIQTLKKHLFDARQGQCTDPRLEELNHAWVRRIPLG